MTERGSNDPRSVGKDTEREPTPAVDDSAEETENGVRPEEPDTVSTESPAEVTTEGPTEAPAEAPPTAEDWHDRYLRLAAEFDNFRKRSARQFGELIRNAEGELIAELTEVLDSLERALDADHKGESLDEFAKGVALIRDQLLGVLRRRGLERMESVGNRFDPEAHDALMRTPSDQFEEGFVAEEVTPGYRLGNKVLRHAKVIVSEGKAESDNHGKDTEHTD